MPLRPSARLTALLIGTAGIGLLAACSNLAAPSPEAGSARFPVVATLSIEEPTNLASLDGSGRYMLLGASDRTDLLVVPVDDPERSGRYEVGFVPDLFLAPPHGTRSYLLGRSVEGGESLIAAISDDSIENAAAGIVADEPVRWRLGRPHAFADGTFDPQVRTLYYTDLDSSAIYVLDLGDLEVAEPGSVLNVDRVYLEGGPGSTIYSSQLGRTLAVLHTAAARGNRGGDEIDVSLIDPGEGELRAALANADRGIADMTLIKLLGTTTELLLFLDADGRSLRSRIIDSRARGFLAARFTLLGWQEETEPAPGRYRFRLGVSARDNLVLALFRSGSSRVKIYSGRFPDYTSLRLLHRGAATTAAPVEHLLLLKGGRQMATAGGGLLTIFDVSRARGMTPQLTPEEIDDPRVPDQEPWRPPV